MLRIRGKDGRYLGLAGCGPGSHVAIVLKRPVPAGLVHKCCNALLLQFPCHAGRRLSGTFSSSLLLCNCLQCRFSKRTFFLPGNLKYRFYVFLGRLRSLHDISQQVVGQLLHHTDLRGRQSRGIGITIGRSLGPVEDRLDHRGNIGPAFIHHVLKDLPGAFERCYPRIVHIALAALSPDLRQQTLLSTQEQHAQKSRRVIFVWGSDQLWHYSSPSAPPAGRPKIPAIGSCIAL